MSKLLPSALRFLQAAQSGHEKDTKVRVGFSDSSQSLDDFLTQLTNSSTSAALPYDQWKATWLANRLSAPRP